MSGNRFLDALGGLDATPFDFKQKDVLYDTAEKINRVYFPFDAVISLVVTLENGAMVESAMIGHDGVAGGLEAFGDKKAIHRALVQIAGTGASCSAASFTKAVNDDPQLLSLLFRHEQAQLAQTQQSVACNANHNIEERFARWMLRARDLAKSNNLEFTQEFISEMLAVGRSTVSLTAHQFQTAGLITYRRGKVQITNNEGLEDAACECYETVRGAYQRLWH